MSKQAWRNIFNVQTGLDINVAMQMAQLFERDMVKYCRNYNVGPLLCMN
jgi:hypothetical protein